MYGTKKPNLHNRLHDREKKSVESTHDRTFRVRLRVGVRVSEIDRNNEAHVEGM